jgi:hypothetical protein
MEVRVEQRDRIVTYVAPLPHDELCMFGSLPTQVVMTGTHVFTGFVQKPASTKTVRKPVSLAFVPKGTPRSWVYSSIRQMEEIATNF